MGKVVNRAWMSTATTGTGTITLGSALSGYQSFADAGVANGESVYYTIIDGSNWEIGHGLYTSSGTTLSRVVHESSNADAEIDLSGSASVFITAPAATFLGQGVLTPAQITGNENDYNPTDLIKSSTIRLSSDADRRNITGIAGGRRHRILTLVNIGSFSIVLVPESASSTAANRIAHPDDIVLLPNTSCVLWFDSTSSRWRVLSSPAIGKMAIWIPATAMVSRTSNGPASGIQEGSTNKINTRTLDFDSSSAEYAQFTLPALQGWDKTTITFKAAWRHPATVTNFGVTWKFEVSAFSNDDGLDGLAFGGTATVSDTGGTTDDVYWADESSSVTVQGSPATGDILVGQVYRDPAHASDNMAVDAKLVGVIAYLKMTCPTED